jgi:predicted permease
MPRWFSWLRPHRADARDPIAEQVRREIDAHLEMATDWFLAQGLSRDEAERRARHRFGDLDAALRRLYATAHDREKRMKQRDTWRDIAQDVRIGLRQIKRAPFFAAAAILALAVGIGANGAVFSILQMTLLQPLPYARPDELGMMWRTYKSDLPYRGLLTRENVLAFRREMRSEVGDIAALITWKGDTDAELDLVRADRTERLNGVIATPNIFDILGVKAARGRLFTARDEPSSDPLLVISDAVWKRDFNGDPAVIGRPVTLSAGWSPRTRRTFTLLGVLPPAIHYTYPQETEAWVMMPWADVERWPARAITFQSVIRRAPGVTAERGADRIRTYTAGIDPEALKWPDPPGVGLYSMRDWVLGDTRPSLRLLGGVSLLLLIVSCITVANGLLVRASERRQELAVREALGASRWRLVRQLLAEGTVLAVLGATAGVAFALAMRPLLNTLLPASVPRIGELGATMRLVGFGLLAAAAATMLAAMVPAIVGTGETSASQLIRSSAGASAGVGAARWRQMLVALQAAFATALMVCASLLLVSFWRLGHVPLGFDGEQVLTAETTLLDDRYRKPDNVAEFRRRLLERVRAIPGVTEAGLSSAIPFRGTDFVFNGGRPGTDLSVKANARFVDSAFFGVLRIPLVRGRYVSDRDAADASSVAVISESLARRLFGNSDPLGRTVQFDTLREVVGVVRDARFAGFDKTVRPAVYIPIEQARSTLLCIAIRAARPSLDGIAAAVHRAAREIDAGVPLMHMTTIDHVVDESTANRRFYTVATGFFAGVAVLLTIGGLVMVVARVVSERKRELAIRMALGASAANVTEVVMRSTVVAAAVGIMAGLAAAYALSTSLSQFVFGVGARAPGLYATTGVVMIAAAALTAWQPARRAALLPVTTFLKAD